MEFKVRAVEGYEPKSVQEVEKELLEKHEEQFGQTVEETPVINMDAPPVEETPQEVELREEDVLSYIGKRYNKQINSFDELLTERKEAEDLPEDVAAYFKYKKETGRGFEDFINLKKDYDTMEPEELLHSYLAATQEGLDDNDIDVLMDDYRFDEDIDDERTIKQIKLAKKKIIGEAKKYFNQQKEKYKMPLESSTAGIPDEEKEVYEAYKQYTQQAKTLQEQESRKRDWFQKKTDEVFNEDFKGFEFNVNDKKLSFTPGDSNELKRSQSTPLNFINKFLDEDGLMKDAAGYHRSLAIAMNPDRFAKFFYEQGLSDATEDVMRKTKNINMSERRAPEAVIKGGMQVKAKDSDSGRNLKIKSIKRI
jgi:hypothetical protein